MRICLLGASFDTGNMGVSALAESSVKIILNRWPDAEITLIGSGYKPQRHRLLLMGKKVCVATVPIRFSKNIFLPHHFLWFAFYGLLAKLLPSSWFEARFVDRNPYFRILYETDIVVDITGGDSFSDIYGMRRFFFGFLRKWLIIFLGKELILLPQTYGPFKSPLTKRMARYVMSRASLVYSRDQAGVEYAKDLLNIHTENGKVRFAPDVAFVLDSREPQNIDVGSLDDVRTEDSIVVGFNISGLLFNGGYTQDNMFALKTDYRELVHSIIDLLMKDKKTLIILLPHVFTPEGDVESDPEACRQVYERMRAKYPDRIFLLQGRYDPSEIKYLTGTCNFFIGSRMHSCIAALSQGIPAVGLAYSRKFRGVFRSVGAEQFVIDMRQQDQEEILDAITESFQQRETIAEHLREAVPKIQGMALNILRD
jgi:polysaccharide pyruvyl transferase WcaK-like protein